MRVIVGTTKETAIEDMPYLPDLPPVATVQKTEQAEPNINAI